MMNIFDVLLICKINLVYSNNKVGYNLIDTFSDQSVCMEQSMFDVIYKGIKAYADNADSYPSLIFLQGHFVKDSSRIYIDELNTYVLSNFKLTKCYIQDNQFYNIYDNTRVVVNEGFDTTYLENEITSLSAVGRTFDKTGNDCIIMIGNILEYGKNIVYENNSSLIVDEIIVVYNTILNYIIKSQMEGN